ncbi:DUF3253 domain-containing protein [Streptomyces sp. NPDC101209]
MEPVRRAAWPLVAVGEAEVTHGGLPVKESTARASVPIRLVRR